MSHYENDSRFRTPRLPDAGWLPDPSRTDLERYWDGSTWTARTRDRVSKLERVPMAPIAQARSQRRAGSGRLGWLVVVMVVLGAGYWVMGRDGSLPQGAPLADALELQQPVGPVVDFPVFGSTDLVRFLATSMVAQEASIDVSYWINVANMDTDDIGDAILEANAQNPYLFVDAWAWTSVGDVVRVEPTYTYASDIAEGRRVATQAAVERGLGELGVTATTPPEDAARAIHDYIADVANYDHVASDEIGANETASSPRINQSQEAYGILVAGTAVCNGYAMAFQAMAHEAGLNTVVVTGTANGLTTGLHAWNRVHVDDTWRTVDVTWDDGDEMAPTRYDYFLIDNNAEVLGTRTADLDWAVDTSLGLYGSGAA